MTTPELKVYGDFMAAVERARVLAGLFLGQQKLTAAAQEAAAVTTNTAQGVRVAALAKAERDFDAAVGKAKDAREIAVEKAGAVYAAVAQEQQAEVAVAAGELARAERELKAHAAMLLRDHKYVDPTVASLTAPPVSNQINI